MKAPVSALLCLLLLPLLAGCTEDDDEMPFGHYVSVRESMEGGIPPGNWTVDVDAQGIDSLPSGLQELLIEAAANGTASRHYTDDSSKPIFDWVDEQWQMQGNEGTAKQWPYLIYEGRTFALSYLLG